MRKVLKYKYNIKELVVGKYREPHSFAYMYRIYYDGLFFSQIDIVNAELQVFSGRKSNKNHDCRKQNGNLGGIKRHYLA